MFLSNIFKNQLNIWSEQERAAKLQKAIKLSEITIIFDKHIKNIKRDIFNYFSPFHILQFASNNFNFKRRSSLEWINFKVL
jgi:hypothetical protein